MSIGLTTVSLGVGLCFGAILLALRWRRRISWIGVAAVGCVGLLGVVLVQQGLAYPRSMALQAARSRLEVIGFGLRMYHEEHGAFPGSLVELIDAGCVTKQGLRSPFSGHPSRGCDYFYVVGPASTDPPAWPQVFDKPDLHEDGARSVLFLSGEVRTVSAREFERTWREFVGAFEASKGRSVVVVE